MLFFDNYNTFTQLELSYTVKCKMLSPFGMLHYWTPIESQQRIEECIPFLRSQDKGIE